MIDEPLVNVRTLARTLGTSERSIYRLVEYGLPCYRLGRGRKRAPIRFRVSEVLEALRGIEAGDA